MADSTKYSSKLRGSRVLIIGGTSGIGFCVAEASLEAGCTVILSSSSPTKIQSSIARLLTSYPSASTRLSGHACDLSPPTLETNIATLFSKIGDQPIDHIVFTAGDALNPLTLADATLETINAGSQVRMIAPLLVAKHARAYLAPGPASSITLSTGTTSERPMPGWIVPGAMAASLHSTTRALALEMRPVRVNLISPGPVETELWDGLPREAYEVFKARHREASATGVFGLPEDVAEAYLYCMRDRNVTGSMIGTNSGVLLMGF